MPTSPEVPEFMVRTLQGVSHPALEARAGSGVVFDGIQDRWTLDADETFHQNCLDEIYKECIDARDQLLTIVNKYRKKIKEPLIDTTSTQSWKDVEEHVSSACDELEEVATKDKDYSGSLGKIKRGFRSFCHNAGVGQTFATMLPTDSFGSVLCGGLKTVFTGLRQADRYREEIYKVLEDLPYIITDNAAPLKDFGRNGELHRRSAALYVSIFQLLSHIMRWFAKNTLVTAMKITMDPTRFSEDLKDRVADVTIKAQRFRSQTLKLWQETQNKSMQLQVRNTYVQDHMNENINKLLQSNNVMNDMKEKLARLEVLENLVPLLQQTMNAIQQRPSSPLPFSRSEANAETAIDVGDFLEELLYEPDLVLDDSRTLKILLKPSSRIEIDIDRVSALQNNPRLQAWLSVDASSLLLLDGRTEPRRESEVSVFSAIIYTELLQQAQTLRNTTNSDVTLVSLAFFCGQHTNLKRDANAQPKECAMSLLLQLIDQCRDIIDNEVLQGCHKRLNRDDIGNICNEISAILMSIGRNIIVVLVLDGLRFFNQPAERASEFIELVTNLVRIYRSQSNITLKFLFASPTRSASLEHLFEDYEILSMPQSVPGGNPRLSSSRIGSIG